MDRDSRIEFIEETHQYKIDGIIDPELVSVTQFIHLFFNKFDENVVIDNMMKSKYWSQSKYFGMSKDEIVSAWYKIRIDASEAGTKLHLAIENFYLHGPNSVDKDIANTNEYKYFLNFQKQYPYQMYKAEWRIFDDKFKIAGSVDMSFIDPDSANSIYIYDWKRSKEIKFLNKYSCGLEPITHVQDCNYWHYSLQLNIYKKIIESNYNLKVSQMAIVVFHPNNNNFIKIDIPDLQNDVDKLFNRRINGF